MTLQQIHVFATKVGISPSKLFGFLARNGQAEPTPIAEIHIEVFTEEAFKKLSQVVHELGMEHATISTKRLTVWNNRNRKPSLSGTDRQAQPNRAVR